MQQLSPQDAAFLAMETPEIPAHVCGLATLGPSARGGGALDFDAFVAFVEERLAHCPRFRWRIQQVPFAVDAPYWVEDPGFDVRRHIRRVGVPAPGGQGELAELVGGLVERPLDRSRPLWEIVYIAGLPGERVGLLWKIHHSLMDGVAGASLFQALFDIEPDPPPRPEPVAAESAPAPRVGRWVAGALRNALHRPTATLRHLSQIGAELVDRLPREGLASLRSAPVTPFNGPVGSTRTVAWSRISLDVVRSLKDAAGVSVNDVVLAVTGESVRRYLEAREALPDESLVAMVPVSCRAADDDTVGNQVSSMAIPWRTDVADPYERLIHIHEATSEAKARGRARRINPIQVAADVLPPVGLQLVVRAAGAGAERVLLPANAVVSNVPMGPMTLYVAGSKIESIVPISMLAPTQGLNLTVLSYCGELFFGVVADPDRVEAVQEIADAIPKALISLQQASARRPRLE